MDKYSFVVGRKRIYVYQLRGIVEVKVKVKFTL